MSTPFTYKDIENASEMARGIIQYIEKNIVTLSNKIFTGIQNIEKHKDSGLSYSYGVWNRFTTAYMEDDDVINDFNRLVTMANTYNINLNQDAMFLLKFLTYLRPQYEKKKRGMAQIVQLGGMANTEKPKKKAETVVKKVQIPGLKLYND